jgi:hypothetical protein
MIPVRQDASMRALNTGMKGYEQASCSIEEQYRTIRHETASNGKQLKNELGSSNHCVFKQTRQKQLEDCSGKIR